MIDDKTDHVPSVWDADLLGRKSEAEFILRFLVTRVQERKRAGKLGSYVLNVDAEWGFGKTFFMNGLLEDLEQAGHPAVFIDAWKNDFGEDPYTHVISEIESFFRKYIKEKPEDGSGGDLAKVYKAVKSNAGKIFWTALKGGAKRASRYVIAEGADEIIEVVNTYVPEDAQAGTTGAVEEVESSLKVVNDSIIDAFADKRIEDFEEAKQSLANFKESLSKLLQVFEEETGKKLPLFILIDELDRCRPTYAITMLERIKHLFDVDDVVFVLSTDTRQIAHAIRAIYGAGFESKRYLQRFFSRTYHLPKPSVDELVETLLTNSGADQSNWTSPGVSPDNLSFISNASNHFGMTLRDIEQSIDILLSLTTVWEGPGKIELSLMYPLIFGFVSGHDIEDLSEGGWLWRKASALVDWTERDTGTYSGFRQFDQVNNRGQLIVSFLTRLGLPIYDSMRQNLFENTNVPSFNDAYIDGQLKEEYRLRFSNTVREEARGDMIKYPALIRHAGHLRVY